MTDVVLSRRRRRAESPRPLGKAGLLMALSRHLCRASTCPLSGSERTRRTNREIPPGHLTVGNRGVTKVGVVERGKLQRYEALEDQKDCRSKIFRVQGGAGGGENHGKEAQS